MIGVGANKKDEFQIGDHVLASFCSCGDCKACKRNEPACCDLFFHLNLGLMDKTLNFVKIPYTNQQNQSKQAHAKYFGQSSFGNVMSVTGRSVSVFVFLKKDSLIFNSFFIKTAHSNFQRY